MSGSFAYHRAGDLAEAIESGAAAGAVFLAGGTDLMPLWKAGALSPETVIDISRLPLAEVRESEGGLTLGALARLADVAANPAVQLRHPLIAEAIKASASGQVRNMATIGGNLLQRTRCAYFRTEGFACNKRRPGAGCAALQGENRQHAIFGGGEACVAVHPSDLAVALSALCAEVETLGPGGGHLLQLDQLYRLPGDAPERDHVLTPGEIITAVHVSDGARFADRCAYLKVRDRASFEFAVVSVAAALEVVGGVIVQARLAAGGVAPRPWRLGASETALKGRRPGAALFAEAAALAAECATALPHNGFKIQLLQRAVRRALETIGGVA